MQTYPHVEHVLIDDGSTDETASILESFARRYPDQVRFVRQPERVGPCRRRNDALDASSGDLLAWLDHDDVWLPAKLDRQVAVLQSRPEVGFVATQWELFDHDSGGVLTRSAIQDGGDPLRRLFIEGCFIASSTVVFRREALSRRGLRFRERDFSWGDDHFLWLALALDWELVVLGETLTRLRRHAGNESVRLASQNPYPRSIELLEELVRAYPEATRRLGSARRVGAARHHAFAAIYELDRRRRGRAMFYAARAALRDPRGAAGYVRRRAVQLGKR
jgi:glycosyltransferase involved in cell wall biosynthesis